MRFPVVGARTHVSTEEEEVRRREQGGSRGSCVSRRSMRGDEAHGGDKAPTEPRRSRGRGGELAWETSVSGGE
jgi:hypothetical protein